MAISDLARSREHQERTHTYCVFLTLLSAVDGGGDGRGGDGAPRAPRAEGRCLALYGVLFFLCGAEVCVCRTRTWCGDVVRTWCALPRSRRMCRYKCGRAIMRRAVRERTRRRVAPMT